MRPLVSPGYAVIDTETTGLHPGYHHRIIELAIVHVDHDGSVTDEWCSLLNAQRDLGPQRIHGIAAAEIRNAPTFAELAGDVVGRLAGRVLVAHNLSFDLRFLQAELRRAGIEIETRYEAGLCTMHLAARFLPAAGRSLVACCKHAGIRLEQAHSALHDAHAAARLMGLYIRAAGNPVPWRQRVTDAAASLWPSLPTQVAAPVQRRSPWERQPDFIARLVDRLPSAPDDPRTDNYLAVLDSALIDRHLSESEQDELLDVACDLGLSVEQVGTLHRRYLTALASAAWADGEVTHTERTDLRRVADLLGLAAADVDGAIAVARNKAQMPDQTMGQFQLARGDLVVFTGEMNRTREEWHAIALAAGLKVNGGTVTKGTRIVVAADPDSLSGKARKARAYKVPIINEATFGQLISAMHRNGR